MPSSAKKHKSSYKSVASSKKKSTHKVSSSGTMTREEAGRLGGSAPHKCRGRECQAKKGKKESA